MHKTFFVGIENNYAKSLYFYQIQHFGYSNTLNISYYNITRLILRTLIL